MIRPPAVRSRVRAGLERSRRQAVLDSCRDALRARPPDGVGKRSHAGAVPLRERGQTPGGTNPLWGRRRRRTVRRRRRRQSGSRLARAPSRTGSRSTQRGALRCRRTQRASDRRTPEASAHYANAGRSGPLDGVGGVASSAATIRAHATSATGRTGFTGSNVRYPARRPRGRPANCRPEAPGRRQ